MTAGQYLERTTFGSVCIFKLRNYVNMSVVNTEVVPRQLTDIWNEYRSTDFWNTFFTPNLDLWKLCLWHIFFYLEGKWWERKGIVHGTVVFCFFVEDLQRIHGATHHKYNKTSIIQATYSIYLRIIQTQILKEITANFIPYYIPHWIPVRLGLCMIKL